MNDSMGNLRNCKKCGRLFADIKGNGFCSRCDEQVDDVFDKVRNYIYDHPTATVNEVATETNVDSEIILKFIREGKIVLSKDTNIFFCERCGVQINSGRFCHKCIHELANGLRSGLEDKNSSRGYGRGMHIKE